MKEEKNKYPIINSTKIVIWKFLSIFSHFFFYLDRLLHQNMLNITRVIFMYAKQNHMLQKIKSMCWMQEKRKKQQNMKNTRNVLYFITYLFIYFFLSCFNIACISTFSFSTAHLLLELGVLFVVVFLFQANLFTFRKIMCM